MGKVKRMLSPGNCSHAILEQDKDGHYQLITPMKNIDKQLKYDKSIKINK